jgi:hypothetical protein
MSIIAAGTTTTTALSSTGNTDGTLQLQVNGTTPSVTLNTLGAIGVGSSPSFGNSGQVLISGGSTVAPAWGAVTVPSGATITNAILVNPALGTPASGTLSNCTVDGTDSVGFRNIPQNAQTGSYTMVLADSGKHIYHASGAGAATYTIPAASSVAYPIGTAITFINLSATAISIAITTDTMYLSSAGTTGTRTLAQYGSATALKVSGVSSSGIWVISGSGLT